MSVARDQERRRLEERARRMEAVIRELRVRARYRDERGGEVPVPLHDAIARFREELAGIDRRLQERRERRRVRPR